MKLVSLILTFLLVVGCATAAPEADSLDAVARDYVRMQLEIGERDEGYVDAYYGPADWREAARAGPRTVAQLAAAAEALQARVAALPVSTDPLEARRRAFLVAQLTAARTRLRMVAASG